MSDANAKVDRARNALIDPTAGAPAFKVDGIDIAIVQCLRNDARMPSSQIAAKLDIPESTVRHRLNRLLQEKVIQFAVQTNPHMLGFPIWVNIELQVALAQIQSVAEQIAQMEEIYFVGMTTGPYDVIAGGVFRSNADLLDFTLNRLGAICGIGRVSTSLILNIVKREPSVGLPREV
jgi:Lrp/AsnC family transcriptional regulator, regulator for asnA, asnC and gidA